MPFFFDVTKDGESKSFPIGPYAESADATAGHDHWPVDYPNDTVGDVYEAAEQHPDSFPAVFMIVSRGGTDYKVWTDGTEEIA